MKVVKHLALLIFVAANVSSASADPVKFVEGQADRFFGDYNQYVPNGLHIGEEISREPLDSAGATTPEPEADRATGFDKRTQYSIVMRLQDARGRNAGRLICTEEFWSNSQVSGNAHVVGCYTSN